jgi:hypothetical protein
VSKKALATSSKVVPPPLEEQLEDILCFIDDQCRKEHDILGDCPFCPPKCEMLQGRAKFEAWEDPSQAPPLPIGKKIMTHMGNTLDNVRHCPYCSHLMTANPPIGSTVECWNCTGKFIWGSG